MSTETLEEAIRSHEQIEKEADEDYARFVREEIEFFASRADQARDAVKDLAHTFSKMGAEPESLEYAMLRLTRAANDVARAAVKWAKDWQR
jgi:hypothetical protein